MKKKITVLVVVSVIFAVSLIAVLTGVFAENGNSGDATPSDAQDMPGEATVVAEGEDAGITTEEAADDTAAEENSPQHTHKYVPATCTEPKTCEVCGGTAGEALGHNFYKGVCVRCGAENPDYTAPVMEADGDDEDDADDGGSASAGASQSGSNSGAGQTASSGSSNSSGSDKPQSQQVQPSTSAPTTEAATEAATQAPATEAPATECQHVWEPYVELQTVKVSQGWHWYCTGCGLIADTEEEQYAHEEAERYNHPVSWTSKEAFTEEQQYVQTGEKCSLCGARR